MNKKFILGFISVIIFIFSTVSLSWALGFGIDKPKIRLSITPGAYQGGEIKVENRGSEALDMKVYLEDWVYSQQDGTKAFMPKGTTPLSCSNWITFYPADFTLEPKGSQVVRYTVTVPEGITGGHFSVMFFETGGGEIAKLTPEGNTVMVKVLNRVGALFYVEAQGTIQKLSEVQNLNIQQKLNDLIVSADFLNTGNTDITARGTFNVIDAEGIVYARGEFPEVYMLPQGKASLRSVAESVNLKAGTYDLLMTLEFESSGTFVHEAQFSVSHSGAITLITP